MFCLAKLELVVLTNGASTRTVRFGIVPRYGGAIMRYESDHIDVTGPLGSLCQMLALSAKLVRLMGAYDVDLVLGLLPSARGNEIYFDVSE